MLTRFINTTKEERSVSKQSHLQPCCHSKAWSLSRQLKNDLFQQCYQKIKSEKISILCTQAERSDLRSSQRKANSYCEPTMCCNYYKYDLYDADYVSYTCQHLYQCIEEHKGSAIRKHVRDQHGRNPSDTLSLRFKILRKCQSKFDCLICEMIFIN